VQAGSDGNSSVKWKWPIIKRSEGATETKGRALTNRATKQSNSRLLRLVLPITAVIVLQALLAVVSLQVLSGVRAYVAGEGLWSKGQKDSIQYITLYSATGDEWYFSQFQSAIAIPLADRSARLALELSNPDLIAAREGFLGGGNHSDDVPSLIWLFRYFRDVSYMATAVDIWRNTDPILDQLVSLGNAVHEDLLRDSGPALNAATYQEQINQIGLRLSPLAAAFSRSLGAGSREIKTLLTVVNLLTAVSLIILIVLHKRNALRQGLVFEGTLKVTNARFDAALSNMTQGLCMFDGQKRLVVWNDRYAKLYRLPLDLLRSERLTTLLSPTGCRAVFSRARQTILPPGQRLPHWVSFRKARPQAGPMNLRTDA
jgi:PAS domain-containing protein